MRVPDPSNWRNINRNRTGFQGCHLYIGCTPHGKCERVLWVERCRNRRSALSLPFVFSLTTGGLEQPYTRPTIHTYIYTHLYSDARRREENGPSGVHSCPLERPSKVSLRHKVKTNDRLFFLWQDTVLIISFVQNTCWWHKSLRWKKFIIW